MHTVLAEAAPGTAVIDLMHDAPDRDPRAAAYLLAALAGFMPEGCVCVAVVDPGVGTDRAAAVIEADGRFFVGPENGLFEILRRRASRQRSHRIDWRPPLLSASFHGRDLFAPVAAMLARGDRSVLAELPADPQRPAATWPDDLAEVVFVDGYGNAMTGLRGDAITEESALAVAGRNLRHARTFDEVPAATAFWYVNSIGLVEIAVNRGSAAAVLGLRPGSPVTPMTETEHRT